MTKLTDQSGPGSNGNEGVLFCLVWFSLTAYQTL